MRGPSLHSLARLLWASLTALLLLPSGCGDTSASPTPAAEKPPPTLEAVVFTVEPSDWRRVVRSQGSLMADELSVVAAKVAGPVAEVHCELGDVVAAGTPLATLDQEEFRLQVSQAQAQLAQARSAIGLREEDSIDALQPENAPPVRQEKALWLEAQANLQRARRLAKDDALSEAELDQIVAAEQVAEARHAAALNSVLEKIALVSVREAELSLAREQLQDATVVAPFDGQVQQRHVAPGTYVQVGDPIATMVRTNPLRFRGTIPERHAQLVVAGQQAQLQIESEQQPRVVRVTRISPALDQRSRALVFESEVDNSDGRLRAGLFAEAEIVVDDDAQALIVPASAVVEFAGAEKVWKVVDGVSAEQEVRTGQRRRDRIEVLEGLAAGDVILLDASQGRVASVTPLQRPPQTDHLAD